MTNLFYKEKYVNSTVMSDIFMKLLPVGNKYFLHKTHVGTSANPHSRRLKLDHPLYRKIRGMNN